MNHAFRPLKPGSTRCAVCGGWLDHPCHSLELFTDADKERQAAFDLAEAERMSATLRTAKGSIDRATRLLELDSPLFYGTIHPTLL